jgi:hypothetical protein
MEEAELQGNWALVVAYRQAPKLADGRLACGENKMLQSRFHKTTSQVQRIIALVKSADRQGIALDLSDRRKGNGQASGLTPKIEAAMKLINSDNLKNKLRTTRRRMQTGLKKVGIRLALGTVHRYINDLGGRLAAWHVKVLLSELQMVKRLEFVAAQIVPGTEEFRNVENDVHVDEKWFYLIMEKGYLLVFPEDELPSTYARHKNDILKVMFLCAVCKPQLRPDGTLMNGLIACEAFTEQVQALRGSVNRVRGSWEEKPIPVDAATYRSYIKERVIPKIRRRLFWKKEEEITVRHDGAKPHDGGGNAAFFAGWGQSYGWNIQFETQCPQSPDANILDIGVFNGLQAKSEEYRMESTSVSDMVDRVKKTFSVYSHESLNNCWGLLHENYRSIVMYNGGNKYCDPHCGIRRRVAAGKDPVNYSIHFDEGYDTEDEEGA